jgi:lipopolysaccharide/colanic/teichoic acid biosynthesis glycosyltransferase
VARRTFDVVAASLGLLVLSPLFLVVAAAVAGSSRGPVFFRQERVGKDGRPFRIFKFRTMRHDAELVGGQLTVGGDARVTRVGALLRATKIDELPQLLNVVRGEMALVGPRPEVPRYVALYNEEQRRVLRVRPGITDPASIHYRDESAHLAAASDPETAYVREVMPHKLALNLEYLEGRTLASDVGVIFATLARLLPGRHGAPW